MLRLLTGSGNKIGPFVLPFIILGFILYFIFPSFFIIPKSNLLKIFGLILLYLGIIVCLWSQILIFIKVPKKQLITEGPYRLVKHPLYTGASLLVLPGLGFLLNNWLGLIFGLILYIATRIYRPEEEKRMKKEFGGKYEKYTKSIFFSRL
jgi:protein-S-isoprenylcysteine O-methyltransferase Ste14